MRMRAIPSRNRTSSSPMTTLRESGTGPRYSQLGSNASGRLFGQQQPAQPTVRELLLGNERQLDGSVARSDDVNDVPVGRRQHHPRRPRQGRKLMAEVDPVSVR